MKGKFTFTFVFRAFSRRWGRFAAMAPPPLRSSSDATGCSTNTTDNMERDRLGSAVQSVQTNKNWEIVGHLVAEVQVRSAAPYTRGSGPPMKPIGIMLLDDKPGAYIIDVTQLDGSPVYIVGYEDKPALRLGVRAANILDYVSERTYENFEIEQQEIRDQKREAAAELPMEKSRDATATAGSGSGRGGRRSKRKLSFEGDVPMSKEASGFQASRKRQARSIPTEQDGLENSQSELDEELAHVLDRQLKGSSYAGPLSKLRNRVSSGSNSLEPVTSKKASTTVRDTRSSSRQTRSASATSVQVAGDPKRQNRRLDIARKESVAVASSLDAANILDELEMRKQSRGTKAETKPAPEPVDSDEEYDVEDIIDHKLVEKSKGGKVVKVKYYLIKWLGDWPNSWEPEENVGDEVISNYERKRGEHKASASSSPSKAGHNEEGVKDMGLEDAGMEAVDSGVHGSRMVVGIGAPAQAPQNTGHVQDRATNGKESDTMVNVVEAYPAIVDENGFEL